MSDAHNVHVVRVVRMVLDISRVIFFDDIIIDNFYNHDHDHDFPAHIDASFFITYVPLSYKHKNHHQKLSRIEDDLNNYHIDEVYNNALNNISFSLHPNCVVDFIFILLIFILFLFILFLRYSLDQTIFKPF